MPLEVVRVEGEPVAVRLNGREFACEGEGGEAVIPKNLLAGIRLSAIPDDIRIKPVESIQGNVIHAENDIGLSRFSAGLATASVEELFRRKFWDGEVGLSPYVAAFRQAIAEHDERSTQSFEQSAQCLLAPRARDQVPRHQHKLGVSLADPLDGTFDGVRAT